MNLKCALIGTCLRSLRVSCSESNYFFIKSLLIEFFLWYVDYVYNHSKKYEGVVMMKKKLIFGLVLALSVMIMPNMTFSMNDPLEDDVNYVNDSMLNRLDEQYLENEEELDEDGYIHDDYEDYMDEDYMNEDYMDDLSAEALAEYEDFSDEDLGIEEDEEELPEQNEVVEVTEMMPQADVIDADNAMM
jgi:hypothetical protein